MSDTRVKANHHLAALDLPDKEPSGPVTKKTLSFIEQVAFRAAAQAKMQALAEYQRTSQQMTTLLLEMGFDEETPHNYRMNGEVLEQV